MLRADHSATDMPVSPSRPLPSGYDGFVAGGAGTRHRSRRGALVNIDDHIAFDANT
jgi:hypothetical protein